MGESTYDSAVPRDRRDRGAGCPVDIVRPVDLVRLAAQGYKGLEAELGIDGLDLLLKAKIRAGVDALGKGLDPLLHAGGGLR